jgi:hypothetical protein
MAVRLHLDTPLIPAEQLLTYRVLLRDQHAITDLVHSVLGQLVRSCVGAEPLLATLDAYFATGGITTETARRLHLSVRAVYLSPRPDHDPHRIRPHRPRPTIHHQHHQAPRLAKHDPTIDR